MAIKKTQEQFLAQCEEKYGKKFDLSQVVYNGGNTPVIIVCPEHGEFHVKPHDFIKQRYGCPLCAKEAVAKKLRWDKDRFIIEAEKVHGKRYDYSLANYTDSHCDIDIICPTHGIFRQKAYSHLQGHGCPMCGSESTGDKLRKTTDGFIEDANKVHNFKYDYSKVDYVDERTKVTIICPKHGEFEQIPLCHLNGEGCPKCGHEVLSKQKLKTVDEFISDAIAVHGKKYDYSKVEYVGNSKKVTIICPIHGEFNQTPHLHLKGSGCPKCANEQKESKTEREIYSFIRKHYNGEILRHCRGIIGSGQELDIYIPALRLAIEVDGLHWHSNAQKPWDYHLRKTEECAEKGIQLLHVFEDEWLHNQVLTESRLLERLKCSPLQIQAEDCLIKEVACDEANVFLTSNDITEENTATFQYGLYHEGELVSLMVLSKDNTDEYNLLKYCNRSNTMVNGGIERLFGHFISENTVNAVTASVDRRWDNGGIYEGLGFAFSHATMPACFPVKGDIRLCPIEFRPKHRRKVIYDSGSLVYKWTPPKKF